MTTINSQEDFLRALSDNPEWRAAVRAQILGEELLQLPARFDAFVQQMTAFVDEQKQINADLARSIDELKEISADLARSIEELKEINARITARLDSLDGNVARLTNDSGWMRGYVIHEEAIRDAGVIALEMGLDYIRTVTREELYRLALDAAQGAALSNELRSFRLADLVIEATDGDASFYIAVEASYIGGAYDVIRALRNAEMLTEFTGMPARAALASVRNHHEIERQLTSERQPTPGAVFWHEIEERQLRAD